MKQNKKYVQLQSKYENFKLAALYNQNHKNLKSLNSIELDDKILA